MEENAPLMDCCDDNDSIVARYTPVPYSYTPTDEDLNKALAFFMRVMQCNLPVRVTSSWWKSHCNVKEYDSYTIYFRPDAAPEYVMTFRVLWPNRGPWNDDNWNQEWNHPYPVVCMYGSMNLRYLVPEADREFVVEGHGDVAWVEWSFDHTYNTLYCGRSDDPLSIWIHLFTKWIEKSIAYRRQEEARGRYTRWEQ